MSRATNMTDAFLMAAVKVAEKETVNPDKGKGHWIARRVALNSERKHFGMVNDNHRKVK